MKRLFGLIGLSAFALAACGGGGGGTGPQPTITTPAPTPGPITSASQTIALSTTAPQTSQYTLTSLTGAVTFPLASVATTMTSTFSTTQPANTPAIQNVKRRPRNIGASPINALAFLCVTPAVTTSLSIYPSFVIGAPSTLVPAGSIGYVAFFDPANATAGWTPVEGPSTVAPSGFTFSSLNPGPTLAAGQTSCFLFFTVASVLPTPTPTSTPTPPASQSRAVTISTTSSQSVTYAIQNYGDTTTFPTGDVSTTLATTFTTTLPSGTPAVQALRLPTQSISNSSVTADAYLCMTPVQTVTLSAWPSFSFTVPSTLAGSGGTSYVAIYNPVPAVWSEVEGPAAGSGSTFTFANASGGPTLLSGQTYCFGLVTLPAPLPSPSPVATTSAGVPAWTPAQHRGYVAASYGGGNPQFISIYAPGQTVASTTITYTSCCINQVQFDSQGNLFVALGNDGMFEYAPGATVPTATFPGPGGWALAIDAQNTIAIGGRSSTVAIYPSESPGAKYFVPGVPEFAGSLAFSPSGELAVPQADGTVKTFARGSSSSNRMLSGNWLFSSVNYAIVSYDNNGNLAVGDASGALGTISVFAPGASTPAYTIGSLAEAQSMAYDSANRLVVGDNGLIKIFAAGGSTLVATIPNNRPVGLAVGPLGDIAMAAFGSSNTIVYQANAHNAFLGILVENGTIAISP